MTQSRQSGLDNILNPMTVRIEQRQKLPQMILFFLTEGSQQK